LVTPEIVRPIPAGKALPEVKMPNEFLSPNSKGLMRTPGVAVTGPEVERPVKVIPMEDLTRSMQGARADGAQQQSPALQFVPMMVPPTTQSAPAQPVPGAQPAPAPVNDSKE
jgi:hypothetical protein